MIKSELRKVYLEKRKQLSEGELAQLNLQLYNLFFSSVDLSFVKVLHCYLPLPKNKEPDTWMIIDRVRREFPQIKICIPRVEEDGNLENIYFEGLHQLQTTAWGIQEPKQGVITPSEKIDIVIVPLLVFDKTGQRVGYGKGYYDKFLMNCRIDCQKIGLSYFPPVERISDTYAGDVALTMCLEPGGPHHF
ncbi:MAG TPA: 5-formyltetrahydrofolate cyclo-ligase [Cyclobacteriaceae bacterium]|nr:5-formyltetrahydrofolate cyclo-ligase [Cyclobacteriaceae bacterium]